MCPATCAGRGRAGARKSAGVGGVSARDPESGSEATSWWWEAPRPLEENARRCLREAAETQAAVRSTRLRVARWQQSEGEKESTRSGGCGGGLRERAEPHREAWNLWRVRGGVTVRGGVRARLRSTGSAK